MSSDLSKAYEAAGESVTNDWRFQQGICPGSVGMSAVVAALPHILEALADGYDAEARRYGDGLNFPPANDWLRAKAEEVRRG